MNAVFTRIRVRILCIVLLAIIPSAILIYHSGAERKIQISREIEENALRLSRFLASNLERDLSVGQGFLNATAGLIQAKRLSETQCREVFSQLLNGSSIYANLGIAGTDGHIECSARPAPAGADLSKLDLLAAILSKQEFSVGFDFNGVLSSEAAIVLAIPASDSNGPAKRILFAVMDLDWLDELAKESHLPPGSAISVTNRKGDAVARYPDPDKWVGKPYPRTHTLEKEGSERGVKIANGIDGVKRLYAYSTVQGKGDLVVHVGIRREAIWEPAGRALNKQLIALGIVSLLAIMAAWFGSDIFLLKQVRTLIQATKTLAGGNLNARSSLSYDQGELGELARAFDEMAETLEWRDAQLRESEVERAEPSNLLLEFAAVVPEPCLILDEDLEILAGNHAAGILLGRPIGDLMGHAFLSIFPTQAKGNILDSIPKENSSTIHQRVDIEFPANRGSARVDSFHLSISKSVHSKKVIFMALLLPIEESPGRV